MTTYIDYLKINAYSVEIEHTGEDTPNLIAHVTVNVQTAHGYHTVVLENIDLDTSREDIAQPLYDAYCTIGDEEYADEIAERGFDDTYQDLLELCLKTWISEGIAANTLFWNPDIDELEVFLDGDRLHQATHITEVNVAIHDGAITHCEVYVATHDGDIYRLWEEELMSLMTDPPAELIAAPLDDHTAEERAELDIYNSEVLEEECRAEIQELIYTGRLFINTRFGLPVVIA